jgi:hypothetical protein
MDLWGAPRWRATALVMDTDIRRKVSDRGVGDGTACRSKIYGCTSSGGYELRYNVATVQSGTLGHAGMECPQCVRQRPHGERVGRQHPGQKRSSSPSGILGGKRTSAARPVEPNLLVVGTQLRCSGLSDDAGCVCSRCHRYPASGMRRCGGFSGRPASNQREPTVLCLAQDVPDGFGSQRMLGSANSDKALLGLASLKACTRCRMPL